MSASTSASGTEAPDLALEVTTCDLAARAKAYSKTSPKPFGAASVVPRAKYFFAIDLGNTDGVSYTLQVGYRKGQGLKDSYYALVATDDEVRHPSLIQCFVSCVTPAI
jgi:hypothetical protein